MTAPKEQRSKKPSKKTTDGKNRSVDKEDETQGTRPEFEHKQMVSIKPEPKIAPVTAKTQKPSTAAVEGGIEQQISFIVRLVVDEQGKPRRTEIEHAQSGKKETFPALDGQRLVTFIESCISAPAAAPIRIKAATPEPLKLAAGLTISDVQVFRIGTPAVQALVLQPDEGFLIQASFQLREPAVGSITAQGSAVELRFFSEEVTSGVSSLRATHRTELVKGKPEYTSQMQVLGLPPGLYRLTTLASLDHPVHLVDRREGPVIHVAGIQAPSNPAVAQPSSGG